MPKTTDWTQLLGEEFLNQTDTLCEEIKTALGWPPLGQAELSPSASRRREKDDTTILADLFERVGPERSVALLKAAGVELLDQFGERVVSEAMQQAERTFAADRGMDGREAYVEGGG